MSQFRRHPSTNRTTPYARRASRPRGVPAPASSGRRPDAERVVVTGLGLVSPLGNDPDEFYNRLLDGESAIGPITKFDASDLSTRIAAEVDDSAVDALALGTAGNGPPLMLKKWVKRVDPAIKYTVVAGKLALRDAGLSAPDAPDAWPLAGAPDLDPSRVGVLVGSALGGFTAFRDAAVALVKQSYRKMSPFCIPFAITNMPGAMLAMDLGLMGPNYPANTACATGNYCLKLAADHIRRGEADVMLAGGVDASVMDTSIQGFIACKALSSRNGDGEGDDPRDAATASRPWSSDRDGFVMGEGCGVLVLESLEHAKRRGARILCEVAGGAFSCDAHSLTEPLPDGRGVALCIRRAVADAGLSASDIDYVNAHGTSTPAGDMAEYGAIMSGLSGGSDHGEASTSGSDGPAPGAGGAWRGKVNSTKGQVGHSLGAAGALEAIACIQALRTGWLHPNPHLDNPDPRVDLSVLVGKTKEETRPRAALSNSFGFGGHNSAVVFTVFDE